jgi:hypothetical protein
MIVGTHNLIKGVAPTNLLMKYSKRKKGSNSFKNSKMIYDSPYTKM